MWISGVWSFHCSPLWLSVNSSRWTSSPQRTFQSWVLVPAKGRALCRLDLLWASWHTSTPGTFDWGSIFFSSSQVLQCCDPGHRLSYLTFRLLFMCPTKGFYRVKRVYSLTTGNLRIYLMFYWCVFSKIRPLLQLEFFICRVFFLSNAD